MNAWTRVATVPVDSGCLLVSDPVYVLNDPRDPERERADYGMVLRADSTNPVVRLASTVFGALLIQGFGGDGDYPLYMQIDQGGAVRALLIDFANFLETEGDGGGSRSNREPPA